MNKEKSLGDTTKHRKMKHATVNLANDFHDLEMDLQRVSNSNESAPSMQRLPYSIQSEQIKINFQSYFDNTKPQPPPNVQASNIVNGGDKDHMKGDSDESIDGND